MVQDDSHLPSSVNTDTQPLQGASILAAGTLLADRFKIIELLGQGGQAQVYRAHDQVLAIDVALKIVFTSHQLAQSEIDSLRNEVLLARQLNNPYIVRIYEFYQTSDYVFFTMALVTGRSLLTVLEQGIEPTQVDRWFNQLLDAMQMCHEAEIVHGDIKPANIMINDQDDLVLVDFGIGKHLTAAAQTSGSKIFIAPEVQESGHVSAASDRYAAGKIMATLVSALAIDHQPHRLSSWRRQRQRITVGLLHPQPHQRLSIAACKAMLLPATTAKRTRFIWGFAVSFVVFVGTWWWFTPANDPSDSTANQATTVVAISTEFNDPELRNIAEVTQLSLQILPHVYAFEIDHIEHLQNNLAIVPSASKRDRERLTELLDSQLLVVLSQRQLGTNAFIHLLVTEPPGDRVLVNRQFDLETYEFASLPGVFLEIIANQLDQSVDPIEYDESVATLLQAIRQALADGNVGEAQTILDRLRAKQVSSFWLLRGEALLAANKGNFEQAKKVLDRLLQTYPARPDLLAERAALALATNDLTTAKTLYQQAVSGDPSQAMWWFELAKIKIIQGDIRSALDSELLQALVKFRQSEDEAGQGLVLNAFGVAYLRLSQFDTATQYFSEALTYRTAERSPSDRVTTLSNLATAQAIEGDYQAADKNLAEAKRLATKLDDTLGIAHIENERGLLLEEQGAYAEALSHYKTALDIRLQTNNSYLQSQSINHVAFIHFLLGDFSLAEVYWRQALQVLKDMQEVAVLHSTQTNLAQLLVIRGQFQQAEQLLAQILSHDELSQEAEFATYLQLSKLNFAQGRAKVAAENIDSAISIAQQINDNRAITESLLWATELAVNLHQYQLSGNYVAQLERLSAEFNIEQQLYYEWLRLRANADTDIASRQTAAIELINKVLNQSVSRISEAKILTDLVGRFDISTDHPVWQHLDKIVTPAMYEAHLAYLAAKDTPESQQSLLTQLDRYPLYWRNYEYYSELSIGNADALSSDALQRLYNLMNDEQRQAYTQFVSTR